MTVIINKKNAGEIDSIIRKMRAGAKKNRRSARPFNALKYCGIIKLREDALAIQKRLRDEWN